MPKDFSPALKYELDLTIEAALLMAAPGRSIQQLAESIYDNEPELVKNIQRSIVVMHLAWLIKRKRASIPVEGQLTLPGMPAYPTRMRLLNGTRPNFMRANFEQLKQYREVLARRRSPKLRSVDRLLEVMEPYVKKNPEVSILEVMQTERAKTQ